MGCMAAGNVSSLCLRNVSSKGSALIASRTATRAISAIYTVFWSTITWITTKWSIIQSGLVFSMTSYRMRSKYKINLHIFREIKVPMKATFEQEIYLLNSQISDCDDQNGFYLIETNQSSQFLMINVNQNIKYFQYLQSN